MPRPGWKVTAAAAGCLPSLQAVASLRSAPCGLSSHHPSLRWPRWPTCPCSLPTRHRRELPTARLPVLFPHPGLCGEPQPAVPPRVGLLSAARDTPACTHTHRAPWGAVGWPHILCWACALASHPGHSQGAPHLRRQPSSHAGSGGSEPPCSPLAFTPGRRPRCRRCPRACCVFSVQHPAHAVTPEPLGTARVLSAGKGAFLTCLLDPRDGALWAEVSFASS